MKNIDVVIGLAAGILIGTAVAYLIAPEKGTATRKKIAAMAESRADQIIEEKTNKNSKR